MQDTTQQEHDHLWVNIPCDVEQDGPSRFLVGGVVVPQQPGTRAAHLRELRDHYLEEAAAYEAVARFLEQECTNREQLLADANKALENDHLGIGQKPENPVTLALLHGARLTWPEEDDDDD